ncbi:MAG: TOBE domain-containing protein, partial [Candidatus Promineifilaceae bacterium]
IMVMNKGRIEQSGTPLELYRTPETPFVARFLGMDNLLAGMVVGRRPCVVETAVGQIEVAGVYQPAPGHEGMLLIRPEAAEILAASTAGKNVITAEVAEISFRGRYQIALVVVEKNGRATHLKLAFDVEQPIPEPGSQVVFSLLPDKCRFYGTSVEVTGT